MLNTAHQRLPRPLVAALVVFLLAAVAAASLIWRLNQNYLREERARASDVADVHRDALERSITRALSATYALAVLVRQGKGAIRDFDAIAGGMLPLYPGAASLQLAPGGIVQSIVPLAGNERAIGLDLLKGPTSAKAALVARETGKLTLDGPFNLLQGGLGAVGRLPVFLDDAKGKPFFWGFTSALIHFPEVLKAIDFSDLERQGYAYELWRSDPDTEKKLIIAASSSAAPVDPVEQTLEVPNATWTLGIAPVKGWNDPVRRSFGVIFGLFFSLLLSLVAKLVVESRAHEKGLEALVAHRTAEVQASEMRYRAVAQSAHEAIITADSAGNIAGWNRGAEIIFGYTEAEVNGRPLTLLMPHRYHDRHRTGMSRVMSGGEPHIMGKTVEMVGLRKDKNEFPLELSLSKWEVAEGCFVTGIIRDISERKQAAEMLRISESKFKQAFYLSPDSVNINRLEDGLYVSINKGFTQIMGYTEKEIIGHTSINFDIWCDPEDRTALINGLKHKGLVENLEARFRTKNGDIKQGLMSAAVIDLDGIPHIISITRDITERKQAERSLAENRVLLQAIINGTSDAIYVKDPQGRYLLINSATEKIVGKSSHEVLGKDDTSLFPPEEAAAVMDGDRKIVDSRTVSTYEEVVTTAGGETEIFLSTKGPLFDASGKVVGLFGIARNITERKRAEEALREAEEQFRSLVEQSIAGSYIIQDGTFAYVNPHFAEIFGYGSAGEMIGLDPLSIIHEKDRGTAAENVRRRLEGEAQVINYSMTALRKDGSTIEVGTHGARATYRGRPAVIGLMQDVSDKKRAEEEIQRYVTQLETAFMSTVEVATTLSEMRDPYTAGHERRVAEIAAVIGAELGLDARRQEGLRVAGHLHDIGKITIPSEILSKPGKLSAAEFQLIKGHPQASYDVLKEVNFPWPVAQVALQHHERIDGSGYPHGLEGEAILFEARILAVADVIEAMSSHRPYRAALGIDLALAEIERGRGTAYDLVVVDACLLLFREGRYQLPV